MAPEMIKSESQGDSRKDAAMIYGINFNGNQIPPGYARKFRKEVKIDWLPRGHRYRLVGVADTIESRNAMLIQADNGHRLLHIETRRTGGPVLYGNDAY